MKVELGVLMQTLGYDFKQPALLQQALTHRSAHKQHNERMEFLGDAILGFIIAEELCERLAEATEGDLSRLRARLVKRETLAEIAHELKLGPAIALGRGELKSGGQHRASILADAVEAILAAIYLDGGIDAVRQCILQWYQTRLIPDALAKHSKDPKTALQEKLQGQGLALPEYSILQTEGEPNQQIFVCQCVLKTLDICTEGRGDSRRRAEQVAAELALTELTGRDKL